MPTFNKEDLKTLEHLSRLNLNKDDEEVILKNIQDILAYMEMLDEVDVKNTKPLSHPIKEMIAPLQEDTIMDKLPTETFLKGAPDRVGNFLKVPVVIEDKEES